jgi:tetratricopeptide (TPR) repeat protein
MESWYRAAVKADALAYTAYAARHDYLLPKWRGAEGEAEEFALRCVRDAPQGSRIYTVRLANLVQQASAPDAKRFLARQSVQEEVAGLLRRWKADFPSSPEARLKEAAILRMEHDRRPVLGLMDEAIALDGEAPELWLQRGKDRFGARDYVGARADLERALSLGSEDASAYLYLGLTAHHGERDYARAIADYDRAIELDATEATTFLERGRAKAQLRRYAAAIADYDRAAAIDVRRGAIYYYRGTCRWQAGQREQAEADFALAARLEPKTRAWANAFRAGRSKE